MKINPKLVQNQLASLFSILFGRFHDGSEEPQSLFWVFLHDCHNQPGEMFIDFWI